MKRRNFIKSSILAALVLSLPTSFLASPNKKKTLVLLELNGGADYLNIVIPYKEKNYYDLRPTLALKEDEYLKLTETLAINKDLDFLHSLYQNNDMAIINGLGYEKENLSHFRAIEIVETGSKSNEYLDEGWLSGVLEKEKLSKEKPVHAIVFGKRKKGHLFSKNLDVLQMKNISAFLKEGSRLQLDTSVSSNDDTLGFLYKQEKTIERSLLSVNKYAKDVSVSIEFENSDISNSFKEAVKIIKSPMEVSVIKLSQKSYDTHANQKENLSVLLKELNAGIKSFVTELKTENIFDEVLFLTYSEFGRRVKENASKGSDHGTATFSFVIGGGVKGGLYGNYPSLTNLKKNNLIYTTEFKSFYNTVLTKWFLHKNNRFNAYDIITFI
ncbi:MAG: hypothetical protein COA66_01255 [Arcobacter sp.]|nr:MAG: hypothetical protein COA66_01255 [Arcobacter sp.]